MTVKEVTIEIGMPAADRAGYQVRLLEHRDVVSGDECARVLVEVDAGSIPSKMLPDALLKEMSAELLRGLKNYKKLREYGDTLFKALVAAVPRWEDCLADEACRRTYFDVQPSLMKPVPWELLLRNDEWLALSSPLIRAVLFDANAPVEHQEWPLRVLIVVGVRRDETEEVAPAAEISEIRKMLRPVEPLFDVRERVMPTTDGLAADCENFLPHIIHFIGHGGESAEGIPSVKVGEWDWTPERVFAFLKPRPGKTIPRPPRLAFLNACRTSVDNAVKRIDSVANAFLKVGTAAVVAMQADVKGTMAGVYAGRLYAGLGAGLSLDAALVEARHNVALKDTESFVREACLATLSVRRSPSKIFAAPTPRSKKWLDMAAECPYMEVVRFFVDQVEPRRDVIYGLWPLPEKEPRQLVIVHGESGVGKSALAAWLLDLCIRTGHYFRYVQLRDKGEKRWLDVLRDIRGPKSAYHGDEPPFDALPYDAFGLFHWQLKHWAESKEPPQVWDGTLVDDPGANLGVTDKLLNAFDAFRAGLERLARMDPVTIVLDDFDNVESGTFWTLWERLFKPIADSKVRNIRVMLLLTDTEYATRFDVPNTVRNRPELKVKYTACEVPLLPPDLFVPLTAEFMGYRYAEIDRERLADDLLGALRVQSRKFKAPWSMAEMREYAIGLADRFGFKQDQ